MTDQTANGSAVAENGARPLRPRILIDSEAGRLNRGQPDNDGIATQLPQWDLLPPHSLVQRTN
jgi:hypothetical protein